MKVTVDRKEEGFLVIALPDGECINVSERLCPGAKEGDIINIEIVSDETKNAKSRISEKFEFLKKRSSD